MQGCETAAVLEILAAAGIETMVSTSDGGGDVGRIGGMYARDAKGGGTALTAARVKLADVESDTLAIVTGACNPREVIDSMADGPFVRNHSG